MRRNDAMRRLASQKKRARSLRPLMEQVEDRVLLTTYTVSNTLDTPAKPDAGSLRAAILASNAAGGTNIINFAIPGTGVQTIVLAGALPTITVPVTINGTAGAPTVALDGSSAGQGVDGLDIAAGSTTVKGLAINGFSGNGISLSAAGNDTITGNFIGTDAAGTTAATNGLNGILVQAGSNTNTISNNTISGNTLDGIYLNGQAGGSTTTTTTGNIITGNFIGVDSTGRTLLANGQYGVELLSAPTTTIGGTTTAAANTISGNTQSNIVLQTTFDGTIIEGNEIGTDSTGAVAVSSNNNGGNNGFESDGILITGSSTSLTIGGTTTAARNVLSGNFYGINDEGTVSTGGTLIEGNYIGTNAAGTGAVPNTAGGLFINDNDVTIGGTTAGARNVISANGGDGIALDFFVSAATIEGNYIGTDATGTVAFGNAGSGVTVGGSGVVIGGTATGASNIIANNGTAETNQDESGVSVNSFATATILSNSIYNNVALGIELQDFANGDEVAPVLTSAVSTNINSTMTGSLTEPAAGRYTVQFFQNTGTDPSGNAEGETLIGTGTVPVTAANTPTTFSVQLPTYFLPGSLITATATSPPAGGTIAETSEFSNYVTGTGTSPDSKPPTISVTASATTVAAGTNVTDTFTITNTSPVAASGVAFYDTIPAGTTFFQAGSTVSSGGSVFVTNGVANATIGRLAAGASVTVTVVLTTGAGAVPSFINTGGITATVPTVTMADMDTASVTTNVTASDDLYASLVGPTTPVQTGQNVTYQITVGNNGPSDGTNVVLTDTLPAGTTYVSATSSTGPAPTISGNTLTDAIGTLAAGDLVTITLVVATSGATPTSITNSATVTGDTPDSDPTNNTATATTTIIASADVAITSDTVAPTAVVAGNMARFTIQYTNNGPSTATDAVLTDTLPSGLTFVPNVAGDSQVTDTNGVLTVALGNLASGATGTVTFTVMASGAGTLADSAVISSSASDPNTTNNTSSASLTVTPLVDLSVSLSGPTGQFNINNPITYTATVTNAGPSPATNVVLTDDLFPGAEFVSAAVNGNAAGSLANQGTVVVPVGTIAAGGSVTVTIILLPTLPGTVSNTVGVTATEGDSNPVNNTSSVTTTLIVPQPIIEFSSTTYTSNENAGTATITLTRVGDTSGAVSVHFSTVTGGNATPGVNYTPVSTTVTFPVGVSTETVTVPVLPDPYDRVNEFVNLQLDTPSGGAILPNAATFATSVLEIINLDPVLVGPTITDVKLYGPVNAITGVEIDTTGGLTTASATNAANYTFVAYGGNSTGDFAAGTIITASLAVYNPATGAVLVFPSTPLPTNELFLLDVNGTRAGAITDQAGNPLNSVYGSVGASDYVSTFERGNNFTYTDQNGTLVSVKLTGPGTIDVDREVTGQVIRLQVLGATKKTAITGSVSPKNRTTNIGTILGLGRFGTVNSKLYTPPFFTTTAAYTDPTNLVNPSSEDTLIGSAVATTTTTKKTTKKTVKAKAITAASTTHAVQHPHAAVAHATAHARKR